MLLHYPYPFRSRKVRFASWRSRGGGRVAFAYASPWLLLFVMAGRGSGGKKARDSKGQGVPSKAAAFADVEVCAACPEVVGTSGHWWDHQFCDDCGSYCDAKRITSSE